MTGRGAATVALAGSGVLLLATTQPWVATVTEAAAGAPRTRGALAGAELVPWLAPVALVAALAVVAGLSGMRWARPLAPAASSAVVLGTVRAVLVAVSGKLSGPQVVSSSPTAWLWVAAVAALTTAVATVVWWSAGRGSGSRSGSAAVRRPAPAAADPRDPEAERRRLADDWRDLSEGRDPTEP